MNTLSIKMITVSLLAEPSHLPVRPRALTLLAKQIVMRQPKDNHEPKSPPELIPAAEPVEPVIPAEDQPERPTEVPLKVSPYDFPPPGPGLFPEIFTD